MRFSHLDLYCNQKWFISLHDGRETYHSAAIDQKLSLYSDLTFEEIALSFGAFIDDYDHKEIFFEHEDDCIRCMNFLNDLIRN